MFHQVIKLKNLVNYWIYSLFNGGLARRKKLLSFLFPLILMFFTPLMCWCVWGAFVFSPLLVLSMQLISTKNYLIFSFIPQQ